MGILRENYRPETLLGALAHAAGLLEKREECSAEELIPLFSWNKIGTRDIAIEI